MSRIFEQYHPEEKVLVLEQARASAQSQLDDERDRADYLAMKLRHAKYLLRLAMLNKPFKRNAKRLLAETC